MATFVLVHGAFHGGWCYARVARRLRDAGHDVYTPTLTGLGEREHLANQAINLSTHIEDVAALLRYEDLQDVILCGHSYGGMVITGVAAAEGKRIKTLIYLDAILPEEGKSLFDMVGPEITLRTMATAGADGRVPCPPMAFFNVNAADADWVESKCNPHPIACFIEALRLGGDQDKVRHRTYICADSYEFDQPAQLYRELGGQPGWKVARLPGGHDLMIDAPAELTAVLLEEVDR